MKTLIHLPGYVASFALGLALLTRPASAQTFTKLHEFGGATDGGLVSAGLVADANGILYGVTASGGNNSFGSVFKFNPAQPQNGITILHHFGGSSQVAGPSGNQTDGVGPEGGLVLSGTTLYGTTRAGGNTRVIDPPELASAGKGTIFKINTDGTGYQVIKNFTGTDGDYPSATLIHSGGVLYGSTLAGGTAGKGAVFKINTDGSSHTVLKSFTGFTDDMIANDDGYGVSAALTLSGEWLYGVTQFGGNNNHGTIFKIKTDGTGYGVLRHFTGFSDNMMADDDGEGPAGALLLDGTTLYGTTAGGGNYTSGTIFKIATTDTDGSTYSVLHHFDANQDGSIPLAGLVLSGGVLYGTASSGGGSAGSGTIFKIGTGGSGFAVLKLFAAPDPFTGEAPDGASPTAPVMLADTTLYGTTLFGGGVDGIGAIFSLTIPVASPAPTITSVTGPANGSYKEGQTLSFTVTFSASVTVTGTPQLPLTIGATARNATYVSGSPGTALIFTYTVQAGDNDADGIGSSSPLVLNGGTIKATTGGTDATLTFTPPATTGVKVDTTAPTVSTVAITSATGIQNSFLNAGDVVSVTVTMSEATTVTGTPQVALNIGGTGVLAGYDSVNSTPTALKFTYTILAGQNDADGIAIPVNATKLNGGTLADAAGNAATLTSALIPFSADYKVDTTAPTISISDPSSTTTATGPVTYTVTYADANFDASTLAQGNITLNKTSTANGTVAVTGTGTTRTVTISSLTGSGTLGISIAAGTASDLAGNTAPAAGPSNTFTVLSTDANLSALTISAGTLSPAFAAGTISYAASVPNATISLTVTPTKADPNASILVRVNSGTYATVASGTPSSALTLNVGANPVDVKVTAQDGTTIKTYTITVTRQGTPPTVSTSATLTGLNGPSALAFDSAGNLYVANYIANTVSKFAPGATTPSSTLTGLSVPTALAFDSAGNLYVANRGTDGSGTTVSKFAPGATTASATLTGLSGPAALAFDSAGNLYVSNNGNDSVPGTTVSKFAPGATTPSATLTGLSGPFALAFDSAGNLYVANYGNDRVRGTTVSKFAPGATTPSATITGLSVPVALAFDSAGNLFVANFGFQATGTTVSQFAPGATTPSATLTGLSGPRDMAFDSAGNLHVSNYGNGTVSQFAPGTTIPSATLTGVDGAQALAFDGAGNLFVAKLGNNTVTRFVTELISMGTSLSITKVIVADADGDLATAQLTVSSGKVTVSLTGGATISTGGNGTKTLTLAGTQAQIIAALATLSYQGDLNFTGTDALTVIATDSAGAAVTGTVSITVFNQPPSFKLGASTTPSATLTGLSLPTALAFDGLGNLFVANDRYTVSKFVPGATTPGATLTGIDYPKALACDSAGNLFVAHDNHTVSKFAPGDTTPSAALTGTYTPSALASDSAGNLFVANAAAHTMSKFAPGDTTPSATLTGLNSPEALAFDSAGNLFVANYGNDTVSKFAPGATTPSATLTGVDRPRALACDSAGNLCVVNTGSTVSKFAPGATTPSATLTGVDNPKALAFDSAGNLYVANYGNGTVSKYETGRDSKVDVNSGNYSRTGYLSDLSPGPAGESGQTVTFTVVNDKNALFTIQPAIDNSGTLTFTPAKDQSGIATVTVTATDSAGASSEQTFKIIVLGTVCPVNETANPPGTAGRLAAQSAAPPAISLATFHALEGLLGGSLEGRRLKDLYWAHGTEIVQIMQAQPALRLQMTSVMTSFQPLVVSLLSGRGQQVQITQEMIDQLNGMWNTLGSFASPSLAETLNAERSRFNGFQDFVGRDFKQWAQMLQVPSPTQPRMMISGASSTSGQMRLEANAVEGWTVTLWGSSDLINWTEVTGVQQQVDGYTLRLTDPSPTVPWRFYQTRLVPTPAQ